MLQGEVGEALLVWIVAWPEPLSADVLAMSLRFDVHLAKQPEANQA